MTSKTEYYITPFLVYRITPYEKTEWHTRLRGVKKEWHPCIHSARIIRAWCQDGTLVKTHDEYIARMILLGEIVA